MTREERKEQADMRDEYHAMEERVADLEEVRDQLRDALRELLNGKDTLTIEGRRELERLVDVLDPEDFHGYIEYPDDDLIEMVAYRFTPAGVFADTGRENELHEWAKDNGYVKAAEG